MRNAAPAAALVSVAALATACSAPAVQPSAGQPPSRAQRAELWVNPGSAPRNLFRGPALGRRAPDPAARFTVLERDTGGFSITYRVRDGRGDEWNVKIGPEAQPEVVASRILWAVGYHQLPSFFLERWTAVEDGREQVLGGARFRPRDLPLDGKGPWSWHSNPFVGTREYNALLSLLMLINSTDLKDDNNEVYEPEPRPRRGPTHLYVVKDLGASLGETGRVDPRRGYLEGFEREPFLLEPSGPFVRFAFRGRHQELVQRIPVTDLHWTCRRVLAIADGQWRDAFRAGNYDADATRRYVARIRAKAQEALALP